MSRRWVWVANYDYTDRHGKVRLRKKRFDTDDKRGKTFRMLSWARNLNGWGWRYGIRDEQVAFSFRALYHLPDLSAAVRAREPVWWTEGEKDADAVRAAGAAATSHSQGAGNATYDQARHFVRSRAPVYVVADLDPAGALCAATRYELLGLAGVRRVEVVRPRVGKDAYDHLAAGYGLADLVPVDMQRMLALAADERAHRRAGGAARGSAACDLTRWRPHVAGGGCWCGDRADLHNATA